MNSILGCEYDSVVTGDHGFEFQEELFLHTCLRLKEMGCDTFFLGLEAMNFPKFDDIVVEFSLNDKKYLFFIQTKHFIKQRKKILSEHLFSVVQVKSLKDVWDNFNLTQYINAVLKESFQGRLIPAEDHVIKYIILTNLLYVDDEEETIEEDEEVLMDLFESLADKGADIVKFSNNSTPNFESIIKHVLQNAKEKVQDLGVQYVQDHFVFISKAPNLEKLTAINDKKLCKMYKVFNQEAFTKIFRRNLVEFNTINPDTRYRKTLTMEDYEIVLFDTILEVDFPAISETFINELPTWIEFSEDTMQNVGEEIQEFNKISCKGCKKLATWKVYGALRKCYENLFVIPLSKISKLHMNALKKCSKKLIIFVDGSEKLMNQINDNENILFIGIPRTNSSSSFEISVCRFEELSEKSQEVFLEKEINLQGCRIKLSCIEKINNGVYGDFMSEVLEQITNETCLGKELLRDKIPSVYIEKWPFTQENFMDLFIKSTRRAFHQKETDEINKFDGQIYIVTGGPGMGKSCGLQNASIYLKENRSNYWVEFFDLKRYSRVFFERKSLTFTKDEAVEFLLDHLITYGPNRTLDRKLLEIYINLPFPPIFLFFDGFDEISPTYEEIVLNLIRALSDRQISSFVTSRLHCKTVLAGIKNYYSTSVNPYTSNEMTKFTKRYWTWKLPHCSGENMEHFQNKFFQYFNSFRDILNTPILLKMLCDITTKDCEKFCENPESEVLIKFDKVDTWTIYGIIFEMSFDGFYEKEGIDSTSNYALAKRQKEIETIRNIHKFLAIVELDLTTIIQIDADVSKDIEILARGFVTRSDDGVFFYVHRTYAEYFSAECIFDELEKYNDKVLEYISRQRPNTLINDFVYRFLMEKIKNNYKFIDRDKLLAIDPEEKTLNYLLRFCDNYFYYVWKESISEISYAEKFIDHIFKTEEVQKFNFDEYLTHADTNYLFIKPIQVVCLVRYLIKIYKDTDRMTILHKTDKIIAGKISRSDSRFLEDYYNMLLNEYVVSDEEAVTQYYGLMKKKFTATWHRGSLFFLYFKLKHLKIAEEFISIKELLADSKKLTDFDTHYIYHLVLKDEEDNNHEFIDNFAKLLTEKDQTYDVLKYYELDHYCRKNFIERLIGSFHDLNLKFVCKAGNSILYYFWIYKKDYLMREFLSYLNKSEIEELTQAPYFNGKSLIEHFYSEENFYVSEEFVTYIFRNFDESSVFEFIPPSTDCIFVQRDLKVLLALGNLVKGEEDDETNIMEKLLLRILEDKFSWKEATGQKILILHNIVGFKFDWRSKKIPVLAYKWLCGMPVVDNLTIERSYFYSELKDIDEQGNTPVHIAATVGNTLFFEHVFSVINDERTLIDLLSVPNVDEQNFFHCFLKEETMETMKLFNIIQTHVFENESDLKERATDLLLQQDKMKRTPFHNSTEEFFRRFTKFIPKINLENLFYTEDEDENTLLHVMPISSEYSLYNTHTFIEKNIDHFDIGRLRNMLQKPNKIGETPLDTSRGTHAKSNNLFKLFTKIDNEEPFEVSE